MENVYYNIMIDRMLEEAKNALTKGIECNVSDYIMAYCMGNICYCLV